MEPTGDLGAMGVSSVATVSNGDGFVNKAAILQDEGASYMNLQDKDGMPEDYMSEVSSAYSRQTSASGATPVDPPQYDAPAPPPEYTRHPSYVEIDNVAK